METNRLSTKQAFAALISQRAWYKAAGIPDGTANALANRFRKGDISVEKMEEILLKCGFVATQHTVWAKSTNTVRDLPQGSLVKIVSPAGFGQIVSGIDDNTAAVFAKGTIYSIRWDDLQYMPLAPALHSLNFFESKTNVNPDMMLFDHKYLPYIIEYDSNNFIANGKNIQYAHEAQAIFDLYAWV
jgi:hypothetical protein